MDLNRMLSQNGTAASKINMIILKEPNALVDRDAGFCSGGDEDELENEENLNSPTDGSEDSIEVKVSPIFQRNKRKCAEPRKKLGAEEAAYRSPLKKRIRLETSSSADADKTNIAAVATTASHFRPWSVQCPAGKAAQDEPLSLVKSEGGGDYHLDPNDFCRSNGAGSPTVSSPEQQPRVPPHPAVRPSSAAELSAAATFAPVSLKSTSSSSSHHHLVQDVPQHPSYASCSGSSISNRKEQRNYKNMTRERRIEANARERTRVHTISAAFDTLRRAVPAYSHNQKLSKLSVLRIACSYILTLSRIAGDDYSADKSEPSLGHCVDSVTRTIQTEGKLRKKKDE